MRSRTLGRFALSITLAVVALLALPASALAAETFVGGPDIYPVYVCNDRTPIAVHYTIESGLATDTTYFLKVRFTPGLTPGGILNRGYTWNPTTRLWAQERDLAGWSIFPTVTTDAHGRIGGAAGWVFLSFGNEDSTGTYHLMISLSATGKNGTFNGSFAPTVTVVAPRAGGGWVHNGLAVGAGQVEARATDEASLVVLGVAQTEAQGVDDDANGIVDDEDEDYGPAGPSGDFRMSVPALTAIRMFIGGTLWSPGGAFVTGPADTDLAVGASDDVAPGAPGAPEVSSGDATASISWAAATDDTAVNGYFIYRWSPLDPGITWGYSPLHQRIATVPSGVTSYVDTGLVNGSVRG